MYVLTKYDGDAIKTSRKTIIVIMVTYNIDTLWLYSILHTSGVNHYSTN